MRLIVSFDHSSLQWRISIDRHADGFDGHLFANLDLRGTPGDIESTLKSAGFIRSPDSEVPDWSGMIEFIPTPPNLVVEVDYGEDEGPDEDQSFKSPPPIRLAPLHTDEAPQESE